MKNNNGFQKQVIDSAQSRRERFPLPYDVYTTASIGEVQPVGITQIQSGSKTTFKSRDVVRMLPMVCPTLGRIRYKVWHHFVGMSDLLRCYTALMTKQVISAGSSALRFLPDVMPRIKLNELSALSLIGASYSVYVFQPEGVDNSADGARSKWHLYDRNTTGDTKFTSISNWISNNLFDSSSNITNFSNFYPNFTGGVINLNTIFPGRFPTNAWVPCANDGVSDFFDDPSQDIGSQPFESVPLDSAHFVFRVGYNDGGSYDLAIAVRLSAMGKRILKLIRACGSKPNFCVTDQIDVMPLFAYYKAYFDTFGLTMWHSWETTWAHIVLNQFDNNFNNIGAFSIDTSSNNNYPFVRFVLDCGESFYTEDKDFIAAHTTEDASLTTNAAGSWDKNRGWLNNIVLDSPGSTNGVSGIGQTMTDASGSYPMTQTRHVFINRTNHTEVDAELLKILYKWTNRETAAGRRIAELLRAAGYGKYVDEQKSNFIGYEEIELNVTDINATADSQNVVTGHNSVVGEYVGKGVGVKNAEHAKTLSYENEEYGFWVSLAAVVVDAGYVQGIDEQLFATNADKRYQREFDGIGKQLSHMSVVVGSTDWQEAGDESEYVKSFGMTPRGSIWKVKQNLMSGGYALRGERDYFLPFSMDKWIDVGDRDCELVPNTSGTYRAVKKLSMSDLPLAGQAWRYLNRYQWLNNFERIFTYFDGDVRKFLDLLSDIRGMTKWEYCHKQDDHFNIQMLCDLECYAPMLPISESYGTTDENDGHGDYTIKAS